MLSLIESNPYLRDPKQRRRWLEENARESSVLEGATGLPTAKAQGSTARHRPMAVAKKSAKAR